MQDVLLLGFGGANSAEYCNAARYHTENTIASAFGPGLLVRYRGEPEGEAGLTASNCRGLTGRQPSGFLDGIAV